MTSNAQPGLPRARTAALLLALLALQFAAVNLATAPLFGDAPRNLHWGVLTAEHPDFLLGRVDTLERIKGFPPDPPSLAERDLWRSPPGSLHRWWGPVAPLLMAAVWWLTGSYTLLQLVVPLAGGATVLLAYWLARSLLGAREALVAAAFLALFPIFREYASTSYTEAISALAVTAAALAYWRGRLLWAALLGGLAALTKLDLLPLYAGAVAGCYLAGRGHGGRPLRYHALALALPLLIASPWVWAHYLGGGSGGPTRGLSGDLFLLIAPQMLELLFYVPWYGALVTLAAILTPAYLAARSGRIPRPALGMLLGWLAAGLLVALVYAGTPGAGNSPRVIIPALPPLALLFAAGLAELPAAWRRRVSFYLAALFLVIGAVTVVYDSASGAEVRARARVWEVLRSRPQGFVLTDRYWETILFTRQPATWFEADEQFQRSIMQDAGNFARYTAANPIRYVVLPAEGGPASADVRAFLERTAARTPAGAYVVYTLR